MIRLTPGIVLILFKHEILLTHGSAQSQALKGHSLAHLGRCCTPQHRPTFDPTTSGFRRRFLVAGITSSANGQRSLAGRGSEEFEEFFEAGLSNDKH